MALYAISELKDEDRIRSYLLQDVNYAAYALGDLDPPYSQHARWIGAARSSEIEGIALHYTSLDPEVLFLMGDETAVGSLLRHGIGPDRVYYTAKPELELLLADFYDLHDVYRMLRMRVSKEQFQPIPVSDKSPTLLVEKQGKDVLDLLYRAAETDQRALHDIAFAPEMINGGYYYGVYDQDRLIAAAGTHIVAKRSKIAAVGNVIVDPNYRCQGLGASVSSAVTQVLLHDGYQLIVLNVHEDNKAAVATYRKLGYQITDKFIEGLAQRR